MSTHAIEPSADSPHPRLAVSRVPFAAPFAWIAAGVRDLRAAPGPSLLYGVLFVAACWATYWLTLSLPWFTLAFLTGLLLMGPYLAAGLYVAARQMQAGEPVSIPAAWRILVERRTNLAIFAVLLALVMAAWVRLSALLLAIQFDLMSPTIDGYLGLLNGQGDPWILLYFVGIGFVLAATVFVIAAVAIPLIVDRDASPFAAISASARAVVGSLPAMVLWATIIVGLSIVSFATLFVGFAAIFPILGYATWHSYRALVR